MPWVKLDEQFAQHPKVVQAGPLGLALHVAALCYCNQYLTDGFLPRATAIRLLDLTDQTRSPQDLIDDLVDVDLWEPVHNGYQIHDYLEYQPSATSVRTEREQAKQRMQKFRRSSDEQTPNSEGRSGEETEKFSDPGSVPVPVTETVPLEPSSPAPQDDLADFEGFWGTYPEQPNGKKPDKAKAQAIWQRLSQGDRQRALGGVGHYRADCEAGTFAKHAHRWLRDKSFEDWQTPAQRRASNGTGPYRNTGDWSGQEALEDVKIS